MIDTHDDMPGAEPDEPVNENDFERSLALRQARARALDRDGWIADEFEFIERELTNVRRIVNNRPKGKRPVIYLQDPREVLEAVKLGVVDKAEARSLLGLKKRRQPRGLRRARTGGN